MGERRVPHHLRGCERGRGPRLGHAWIEGVEILVSRRCRLYQSRLVGPLIVQKEHLGAASVLGVMVAAVVRNRGNVPAGARRRYGGMIDAEQPTLDAVRSVTYSLSVKHDQQADPTIVPTTRRLSGALSATLSAAGALRTPI